MTNLFEFIKSVSQKRVEKAKILIDQYNQRTEASVKQELMALTQTKGEKLVDIDEKPLIQKNQMEVDYSFDKNRLKYSRQSTDKEEGGILFEKQD